MASASVPPHVISSDGLVKFRLYYFVRKWGKEVIFQVFSCCFLEGSSKSIAEILTDNGVQLNKKNGKYNPFDKRESELISKEPPESLDISALNKICQFLWDKGVKDPGDKLKNLITQIKNERNNVSHQESNISQSELRNKLQDFGKTLEEALDEAALHYSCHTAKFNQWKIDVGDEIPKIQEKIREKYDPSKKEDCDRLKAEIEEFGDHLREYIRERSKEELKPLYMILCRFMPFPWLCQYGITDPCKIIVSLKMDTDKNFHRGRSNHAFNKFDQNEVLNKTDLLGNDPEVVIISGNGGSGKTTLLCSMVEKWYKNEADDFPKLSSYQVLLYMEFRKDDHDNFDAYLQHFLQHVVTDLNFNLVKSSILRLRCLVLCDGFDEKNARSLKLFEEILSLRLKCNNMKIVVTTRPVHTEELTYIVNKAKGQRMNLSVVGLQNDERIRLVKKLTEYLVKNETDRDETEKEIIKAFESMAPGVKTILKNPLQLNLFILLFIECPNLRGTIRSVSKLYNELWKQNSERLSDKLGIQDAGKLKELEQFYRQYALKFHLQKKFEIRQQDTLDFKTKCNELNLNFESVMSTYFNIKHSVKDLDLVKIYCYRHRTEQDFGAAGAICDMILKLHKEKRLESIQLKKEMMAILATQNEMEASRVGTNTFNFSKELREIVKFVIGILYNTDKDLLHRVIDDILSMVNLQRMIYYDGGEILLFLREANNDPMVIEVIAKRIKDTYGQSWRILALNECDDFSGLPELLSRIQPESLRMSCSDEVNPDDIPDLIQVFECAVRNDVHLSLMFGFISEYESSRYSDRYLELGKTCHCFCGRLSQDGLRHIPTFIEQLFLQLDIKMLDRLSRRLPDLRQLSMLHLYLHDDGSSNIQDLSVVNYPRGDFKVYYRGRVNLDVKSTIERIAKVLNSLWPPQREGAYLTSLNIVNIPAISKDAVNQLKESLQFPIPDELVISYTEDNHQIERIHVVDGAIELMKKEAPVVHKLLLSSLGEDAQQKLKDLWVNVFDPWNNAIITNRSLRNPDVKRYLLSMVKAVWMAFEKSIPLDIMEKVFPLLQFFGLGEIHSLLKDALMTLRTKPFPTSDDSDNELQEWWSIILDFIDDVSNMDQYSFLRERVLIDLEGGVLFNLKGYSRLLSGLDFSLIKVLYEGFCPRPVAKIEAKKSKGYEEPSLD